MAAELILVDARIDFYLAADCGEEEALEQLKRIGLSRGLEESICRVDNVDSAEIEELLFEELSLEESSTGPSRGSVGCRVRIYLRPVEPPMDLASVQSLAEQAIGAISGALVSSSEDSQIELLEPSGISVRIDRDSQVAQVASSFSMSRAEVRRLVHSGAVRVNGQPLSDDIDIKPGDQVQLGRRLVRTL